MMYIGGLVKHILYLKIEAGNQDLLGEVPVELKLSNDKLTIDRLWQC